MTYDIIAIKPQPPKKKRREYFSVEKFTLPNRRWSVVVEVVAGICPEITAKDQDYLARMEGRFFIGAKSQAILLSLRKTLLNRKKYTVSKVGKRSNDTR